MSRIYEALRRDGGSSETLLPPNHDGGNIATPLPVRGRRPQRAQTDLSIFVQFLRRNRRLIVLTMAVVFAIIMIVTLSMKPVYEPEARLEIDPPGNETFALELPHIASNDTEYLQTQVQNLQSKELALEVIRQLHLAPDSAPPDRASDGDFAAPDMSKITPGENIALREFQQRLKVEHDPGSQVISISVAANNPVQAATITNTLASLYADRISQARNDAVRDSVSWLSKQLNGIHGRMAASNRALADFESANGVADVEGGENTFGSLLADLDKQQSQIAADRIRLQALLGKNDSADPDSLPQIHDSKLIQDVTQQLIQARSELAESRAIYGSNHPRVLQLQDQVNELQAQLAHQKNSILNEVKANYAAARAQEILMSGEVKKTTAQLKLLAQYSALKREAEADASLYNTLYSKIEDAEITASSKSSNVRIVDHARVLDRPTRPRRALNAGLGLVGGLLLGIVFGFVRDGLDRTLRTGDMEEWQSDCPVSVLPIIEADDRGLAGGANRLLQMVRGARTAKVYEALLVSRPKSAAAEAIRGVRTSLTLSPTNRQAPQSILIASSLPGEGKTTVAMNLAVAFSQQGPTCVVDCDLHNSAMSSIFKRVSSRGLGEVLTEKLPITDAVFETHIPGLSILPSGGSKGGKQDLITADQMRNVLDELGRQFTFIVVDSPPVLPYVDGRVLSTVVDGVVFVGRPGVTSRVALKRSLELLAEVHSSPILEIVLNAVQSDSPDYSYYNYAYK